jgi:hypothetical protein
MSPVASLSGVGLKVMFGRLRLRLYVFLLEVWARCCGVLGVLKLLVRFVKGG